MFLPGAQFQKDRLPARVFPRQNAQPPPMRNVSEGASGGGYPVGWTDAAFIRSEYALWDKSNKYRLAYHMILLSH